MLTSQTVGNPPNSWIAWLCSFTEVWGDMLPRAVKSSIEEEDKKMPRKTHLPGINLFDILAIRQCYHELQR